VDPTGMTSMVAKDRSHRDGALFIASTVRFHDVSRRNVGRLFWDPYVERPRISDDVAERH